MRRILTTATTLATAVAGMKLGARDYLRSRADRVVLGAIGEAEERRAERPASVWPRPPSWLGRNGQGVGHEINNPMHVMLNEAGWIKDLLDDPDLRDNPHHLDELRAARGTDSGAGPALQGPSRPSFLTLRCSLDTRSGGHGPGRADRVHPEGPPEAAGNPWASKPSWMQHPDLPRLHAPRSEWEQILTNVIDDALDAMERGGGDLRITAALDGSPCA